MWGFEPRWLWVGRDQVRITASFSAKSEVSCWTDFPQNWIVWQNNKPKTQKRLWHWCCFAMPLKFYGFFLYVKIKNSTEVPSSGRFKNRNAQMSGRPHWLSPAEGIISKADRGCCFCQAWVTWFIFQTASIFNRCHFYWLRGEGDTEMKRRKKKTRQCVAVWL